MNNTLTDKLVHEASALPLVKWPDPILSEICSPVDHCDDTSILAANMIKTMTKHNGVGLAAPQVGVTKQICVVLAAVGAPLVITNPTKLIVDDSTTIQLQEGCLSVPGYYENRYRAAVIELSYQTIDGTNVTNTFHGEDAFIIQHELDHLNGKLFIDGLSNLKLGIVRRVMKKHQRK